MEDILILNIESSAEGCSVSLGRNGTLLDERSSDSDWRHSKELSILIEDILNKNDLGFHDLSAVTVSKGPGSYTGLRVGTSAAKAICYAKRIPLIAIGTLKVIASRFGSKLTKGSYVIPMIDARRDEVYYAVFDHELEKIVDADNMIINKDSLKQFLGSDKKPIICGNGAGKAEQLMQNPEFDYFDTQASAIEMVDLSYKAFLKEQFEDTAYFRPFYLKPPNITKSKKPLF